MRIEVLTPRIEVAPGATCQVELEVFNTGDVIDTVTSRVVGSYPLAVEQRPATLSLFPGTSERVTVSFTLPPDYPAGGHLVPVEMVSAVAPDDENTEIEVALEVAPVVRASIDLVPSDVTCGRRARFSAHVANEGNTPLNLSMTGTDPERALSFSFDPVFVRVQPGQHIYVSARSKGKRPFFGVPLTRQFAINADGPGVALTVPGRVNQKPWIPRGLITVLTLLCIIGLWAFVVTAGANLVLNRDKLTKSVPAAFLVGQQDFSGAAVAGSMTGIVTAATDGTPVERMTVEAYRIRTGRQELIQSAATGADGSWKLDAVLPGKYHVRFSAPGFQDVWYPEAPDSTAGTIVEVKPVSESKGLDVKVQGLPGTINGAIAAGEQATINGIVTVRSMAGDVVGDAVGLVTTTPDGAFSITGLATPATYQLAVSLEGFTDQLVTTALAGGQTQVVNTVQMAAGEGILGGTVTSGSTPLGGVVVTVTGAGKTFTVTTPTSGPVGQWSLTGLPTPATYVVTFLLDGYGIETLALDLAAGEIRSDVNVSLVSGTGSISGVVKEAGGSALGDVTVTVTGSATPIVTKTLTTGDVGAYTLSGLATPGRYTVTFALDGFSPVTRAVTLGDSGTAEGIDITLTRSTGAISGTITAGGKAAAGAAITVGDGRVDRATTSADQPAGGYRVDALPAGSYTVTVELAGFKKRTVLVTVTAGGAITVDIALV
ncbi:MAG: carboxypeptidase regulatory-like protein, partial [Actinomycetia bacterium]|nr:carboxypeptidase regulatory-like protein [Actinomycetes bacterium]